MCICVFGAPQGFAKAPLCIVASWSIYYICKKNDRRSCVYKAPRGFAKHPLNRRSPLCIYKFQSSKGLRERLRTHIHTHIRTFQSFLLMLLSWPLGVSGNNVNSRSEWYLTLEVSRSTDLIMARLQRTLEYVGMRWHMGDYVDEYWNMLMYIYRRVCWHTPLYSSIFC